MKSKGLMGRKEVPAQTEIIEIHKSFGVIPLFLMPTRNEQRHAQSMQVTPKVPVSPSSTRARRALLRDQALDQIFGSVWSTDGND